MARLVNGKVQGHWREVTDRGGEFVRAVSPFRDWVTTDSSARFPAEPGRYHLYVSLACPWAHRTLIFRKLKQLEDVISVSVVDPVSGDDGWRFSDPSASALHPRTRRLHRARDCASAVGSQDRDNRKQ